MSLNLNHIDEISYLNENMKSILLSNSIFQLNDSLPMNLNKSISRKFHYYSRLTMMELAMEIKDQLMDNIFIEMVRQPIETVYLDTRCESDGQNFKYALKCDKIENHMIFNNPRFIIVQDRYLDIIRNCKGFKPKGHQTVSKFIGSMNNAELYYNYGPADEIFYLYEDPSINVNANYYFQMSNYEPTITLSVQYGIKCDVRKVILIDENNYMNYLDFVRDENINKIVN